MKVERVKERRARALRRWVKDDRSAVATWWLLTWHRALTFARIDREHPILTRQENFRE